MRPSVFSFALLAVTQVIGWGTVSALPAIAAVIAQDLSASPPAVFLCSSILFIAMALAAPDMLTFWAAWALAGGGGSLFLTTSAYAYLAQEEYGQARSRIGALMLATGLSASLFLPITALLLQAISWRGIYAAYGLVMLTVVAPVIHFALPPLKVPPSEDAPGPQSQPNRILYLLVGTIALNSFVSLGAEVVGIELMRAMGMSLANAAYVVALLGVFKVGGRLIDLLGGTL